MYQKIDLVLRVKAVFIENHRYEQDHVGEKV